MPPRSRPYHGEADYDRMRSFLTEIHPLVAPHLYCTVGDLDWWRWTDQRPDAVADVRLWLDGADRVVGFAWPIPEKRQVELVVHPDHRPCEPEMLEWAETFVKECDNGNDVAAFTAWAFTGDEPRQALLRERGYERQDVFLAFRGRSLDAAVPTPVLPTGYALRHVRGEEDIERRVAVHRDAFAPSRMTAAKHRAVMLAPTYRSDLDLVVEAPDGSFAAFCIVWFDDVNRIGEFEPVGTHSAHRRLGLGKAIMYEGLRRLQTLGAETAYVNSWLADGPAAALYDSVGLVTLDRNYAWAKAL